jgi:hypothetical protein
MQIKAPVARFLLVIRILHIEGIFKWCDGGEDMNDQIVLSRYILKQRVC